VSHSDFVARRSTVTLAAFERMVGQPGPVSEWLCIDQAMVDGFAALTGDDAFIHVNPARAATTQFGGTVAHGLLTLSLLPRMLYSATPVIEGTRMGVNYGFDRVRFVKPVPVGIRVRGRFDLSRTSEVKPGFYVLTYEVIVEIENQSGAAAYVRWLLGRWIDKSKVTPRSHDAQL
jgi:acyl dehydratase